MDSKILLVGWGYPPNIDGGLDIHVKHLFEELQKADVDVTLALPEDRAPDREDIVGVETGDGDMVWQARNMSSEIASLAEDYDIIHTQDWFGAEAGFKAKKYSNCKWISTLHSLSSGRSRRELEGEVADLEELAATEPDKVIAVSEKLAEEVKQEFGRRPEVVHNGFSKPSGKGKDVKEELSINGDMVFFVGRHAEQKGIEHLLYGFKKFLENGNNASLVIGGDGYMRESLEKFAEMLDIKEKVYFEGFIPSEQLGDYYGSADLFVSPSINEPFGLTITEALESNTAVAATENGVSELISGNSIVSIDSNSDSIARGLREGLERQEEVKEEGRSWKDMAEDLIEVYSSL
jgi:glycosyltransferase involved in cell wall biosynthesis